MKVKDLKPADYNPRVISAARLKMLKKSMDEFGDLSGIVRNVETGNLVGGHQRLKHLDPEWTITATPCEDATGTVAEGYIETPRGRLTYREVRWPLEKEMQANVAANNQGGENDKKALIALFKKMGNAADPKLLGFNESFFKQKEKEQLCEGYEVVVECADETDMKRTYACLQQEGYKCRLLIF